MPKRKQITVSPAASTPAKRKAERNVARAIKRVFKATRKDVLPDLMEAYREIIEEHRKALNDETDHVLRELQLDTWAKLVADLTGDYEAATTDAVRRALLQLRVDDQGIFDLVNAQAVAYAQDRAAELVGMKWINGELVPNPSATWAITESTRTAIRDLTTTALTDGLTVDEFKAKLMDAYAFSDSRAEMIARTEIARAHIEGTLDAWKGSGVVEGKRWILGSEHDFEDECNDNEDEGVIDLEDSFSSGDDGPPAHPNCVCALVTELTPKGDDETEEE